MRHKLREARIARNMKPADVAKAIGISERGYRYIESGERKPSIETALKIEALFGIPPRELVVQNDSTVETEVKQPHERTA